MNAIATLAPPRYLVAADAAPAPASASVAPEAPPQDTVAQAAPSPMGPPPSISLDRAARELFRKTEVPSTELTGTELLNQGRTSEVSGYSTRTIHDAARETYYAGKIGPSPLDAKFEKRYLAALDAGGNEKWVFTGASMTSAPTVDAQGNVYFRSRDRLHAVDPSGRELWSVQTSDVSQWEHFRDREPESLRQDNPFNRAPVVGADGTAYLVASDDALGFAGCRVVAVKDGHELWRHPVTWTGASGADFALAGDGLYVRERVQVQPPQPKSFLGSLFAPRPKPAYVDRTTVLGADGSTLRTMTEGDPFTPSWSDDNAMQPFAVAPDGTAYSVHGDVLQAYHADGSPAWDFSADPPGPDPTARAYIPTRPVTDPDGNVYLAVDQYTADPNLRGTRVIKLDPGGHTCYDTLLTSGRLKGLDPVLTPSGDLAVVTEENSGGIGRTEVDHIHVLDPSGKIEASLTSSLGGPGWNGNSDRGAIRSLSPGKDGELLVELEPYYYTSPGGRSILAVPYHPVPPPTLAESETASGDPTHPSGIVLGEETIVINGVKLQRREG